MSEGLDIPVTAPGAPAAAATLERVASAIDRTGRSAVTAASAMDGLRRAADTFNEVHQALSTVASTMSAVADGVVALATEQDQLDRTSRRLGLNFDDMATAAGRFTDETQAMALGTTLAAQGLHLTQQQGESLMTAIGAASERQNITMQEAIDRTTAAIVRGRVTGLQPYGEEAARMAGSTHTAQQRLDAIVTSAEHVARAHDNAADQVARLRDTFDDSKRTVAASFVRELATLQNLTHDAGTTSERVEDLGETFTTVGETIATAMARAVVGVQMLGAAANIVIGGITGPIAALSRAAAVEGVGIDAARARLTALREGFSEEARNGRSQTASREMERLIAQAEAITARAEGAGARRARARTPEGRLEAAQDAALDRAFSADTPIERPDGAGGGGQTAAQRAQARLASQTGARSLVAQMEADARDRRAADFERLMGDGTMPTPANDNGGAEVDQRLAAQEMEDGLAQKERDRLDASALAHESYTGRLAELNAERVHGAQMAAESTAQAFELMGKALATHVQAFVDGKESIGTALQGMLADILTSVGHEAIVKGAMEFAHGAAALAGVVTAPLAPGHFAAGALYMGVGALASVAGAAVAPSSAGSGAASGGGQRAADVSPQRTDAAASGGGNVTHVYYAPVIGGRESTNAEVGTRLQRYDDDARARLRREAA